MFYDSELYFLQKTLTNCHLQNLMIDPKKPLDERVDKGLRKLFYHDRADETFFDLFPHMRPKTVYRMRDMLFCRYIFLKLPFCEEDTIFLVGPYLNTPVSREQLLEAGEQWGLSPAATKNLEAVFSSFPVVKDEGFVLTLVNTFAEFLWSGSDKFETADISREHSAAFFPGIFTSAPDLETNELSIHAMEDRYNYENELIDAVSQGNIHKAERMLAGFSTLSFEKRASDPLRNAQNYCIIMNTLLRKAAEKGGVHPVYLDNVSSDFAKRIETIHTLTAIPAFMLEILRTYCRLVRRHAIKDFSPSVQKAIIKIESDLTADLRLSTIAKLNNVSPGYFSGLFKRETGQTLTDYVNNRRIHHAKHLLKNTGLQIQTIAQHCGILDLHYFCRVFKQITGKTPTEYRQQVSFE